MEMSFFTLPNGMTINWNDKESMVNTKSQKTLEQLKREYKQLHDRYMALFTGQEEERRDAHWAMLQAAQQMASRIAAVEVGCRIARLDPEFLLRALALVTETEWPEASDLRRIREALQRWSDDVREYLDPDREKLQDEVKNTMIEYLGSDRLKRVITWQERHTPVREQELTDLRTQVAELLPYATCGAVALKHWSRCPPDEWEDYDQLQSGADDLLARIESGEFSHFDDAH